MSDWLLSQRAARRAEGRAYRAVKRPKRTTPVPVSEDAVRTWRPEDKCPDHAMNVVLEVLMERGSAVQAELSEEIAVRLEIPIGTGLAYVSASLLAFREAGWARCVTPPGNRNPVWGITE